MDYDYSMPKRLKKKSPSLFFFIVFLLIISAVLFFNKKNALPINNPASGINLLPTIEKIDKIETREDLLSQIKKYLADKPGTYSVYVSDFAKGESFGINENTIYTAASLNKIPILAALYYYAGKKEIDLDRDITIQPQDIQEGTGSIQYNPASAVYSYKTLARLMTEQSDNTAAYLLANQILTIDKIQNLVNTWGLSQTDMKLNKTSNIDQAKILRMIYEGKITNKALTAEMLDFLKDSDFEDRLPALLPPNIAVYHKIGSEVRNIHDVGIVDFPNHPYYIGVLISDNPSDEDAVKIIAQISKLVFNYFNSLP